MTRNMVAKVGWRMLAAALLMTLLLIYVPTTLRGMIAIALLGLGTLLIDHRNSLLLAISLAVVTLLLEGGIRLVAGERLTPYYRPHEMLALEKSHKPSERIEMRMPHGDLLAIDPSIDRTLATPRDVRFHTDELGFRNEQPLGNARLAVVGDSFVAGDGSSQEDTITARLLDEQRIPAYNLGFQAGPFGYAERIAWARRQFPAHTCLLLMMFEGNDFQLVDTSELRSRQAVPQGVQAVVKKYIHFIKGGFVLSKVIYGLITRAQEIMRSRAEGHTDVQVPARTFVGMVHGQPVGFLSGYADVTRRSSFDDRGFIRDMLLRAPPDMIFFVPDKYRVYGPLLDSNAATQLPNAQWQHLSTVADELRIDALDLADALREKSAALLSNHELTFWPDDTHWNGHGTSVAAREISKALSNSTVRRCRAAAVRTQTTTNIRDGT